jgi:hypothetical protein
MLGGSKQPKQHDATPSWPAGSRMIEKVGNTSPLTATKEVSCPKYPRKLLLPSGKVKTGMKEQRP